MVIQRSPGRYDIPPRHREYVVADFNDASAYDAHGILKDGHKIRVPLDMMDNAPSRRPTVTAPLVLSSKGYIPEEIRRHMYDDILGVTRTSDAPRRRKVRVLDPDEDDETDDAMRDHRPGFRTNDAAGAAAVNLAYSEMVHDLSRQWMTPEQRTHDARQVTTDAARPAGVSDSDWARELNRREIADAWRQDAPAVQTLPFGAWLPSTTRTEGASCSVGEGEAGVWTKEGEYMYCRPKPQAPTRSGTSSGSDALLRNTRNNMSAADGERLKAEAYEKMCSDLRDAWKKQG